MDYLIALDAAYQQWVNDRSAELAEGFDKTYTVVTEEILLPFGEDEWPFGDKVPAHGRLELTGPMARAISETLWSLIWEAHAPTRGIVGRGLNFRTGGGE